MPLMHLFESMSCVNYSARKREARHVQRRQLEMHLGSIEFYIYVMHSSRGEIYGDCSAR